MLGRSTVKSNPNRKQKVEKETEGKEKNSSLIREVNSMKFSSPQVGASESNKNRRADATELPRWRVQIKDRFWFWTRCEI